MKFYDIANLDDEQIADIIEFEDGVCVLKLCIYSKVHCFDNFKKLHTFLNKTLRLNNYKLIHNGLDDSL